eukprot:12920842-Ditylum_brightwellii.AAC.1
MKISYEDEDNALESYDMSYIISLGDEAVENRVLDPDYSFNIGNCESIEVCGEEVDIGSNERIIFDSLVKVSGQEVLTRKAEEQSSQYNAACWMIKNDTMKIDYSNEYSIVQRYVAALMFYTLDGASWTNSWSNGTGYLPYNHECEWNGITCNEQDLIININLAGNNLKGELVRELGELIFIDVLNLESNALEGSIPLEISNIWSLEVMKLGSNMIDGRIPTVI